MPNRLSDAMSDETGEPVDNTLKCACKECGNNIEYPESSEGTTVVCPHCNQWTELNSPEEPVGRNFDFGKFVIFLWLLLIAGMAGAGYWYLHRAPKTDAQSQPGSNSQKSNPAPLALAKIPPPPKKVETNSPATNQESAAPKPVEEKRPKSPDDLKVGAIKIEKTKGNGLIHAVGTIKNDSAYERYGVTIVVDLIDVKGGRIGSTRDYKDLIEPHKTWQFKALVTDKKAVGAVVSSLKEQE